MVDVKFLLDGTELYTTVQSVPRKHETVIVGGAAYHVKIVRHYIAERQHVVEIELQRYGV